MLTRRCGMRWRLAVVVVVAAGSVVVAPRGAMALSCAPHPDAAPRSVAEGTEKLAVDGTFRDRYDGAIFGTVVSMDTQHDGAQPDYGRTEVVVDVTGTYGPEVASPAVIVEDDPGWLNGYAFDVGAHYFIPYVEKAEGRYSHLCDPIAEVDPADVPELVEIAEQHAWQPDTEEREPSEAAAGGQPPADDAAAPAASRPEPVDGGTTAGLVGLLATAAAAVAWVLRRRSGAKPSVAEPAG